MKEIKPNQTKVALVLSGGGARGIAHIGAIKALIERGYTISSVAGASMGSIVGGFYAAGKLDELTDILYEINKKKILGLADFELSFNHFLKGEKIMKLFHPVLGDRLIEDLEIPYTAVATDIGNDWEVVFDHGSLIQAIRASISMPPVLKPAVMDGNVLADGGIINPLPANRVKRTDGDILATVNVYGFNDGGTNPEEMATETDKKNKVISMLEKPFKTPQLIKRDYFTIVSRTIMIMIQQLSRQSIELAKPQIMIDIPTASYGLFEFNRAKEIEANGYEAAMRALDRYENREI